MCACQTAQGCCIAPQAPTQQPARSSAHGAALCTHVDVPVSPCSLVSGASATERQLSSSVQSWLALSKFRGSYGAGERYFEKVNLRMLTTVLPAVAAGARVQAATAEPTRRPAAAPPDVDSAREDRAAEACLLYTSPSPRD